MSINDLVKKEVNIQVDAAIEGIPADMISYSDPRRVSKLQYNDVYDFLLGYELGYILSMSFKYYQEQMAGRQITKEQDIQIKEDIENIIYDRLPEIRQAMLR